MTRDKAVSLEVLLEFSFLPFLPLRITIETKLVVGRQTGENPCGLPFAFPSTNRNAPVRLFRRGIAGLDCRRPQRQTRGLELAAEHKTGETPA
jgi:hypothetical protein